MDFFGRALAIHEWMLSGLHILLFGGSCCLARWFRSDTARTLSRHNDQEWGTIRQIGFGPWARKLKRPRNPIRTLTPLLTFGWPVLLGCAALWGPAGPLDDTLHELRLREISGIHPRLELRSAEIAKKPKDWDQKVRELEKAESVLERLKWPKIERALETSKKTESALRAKLILKEIEKKARLATEYSIDTNQCGQALEDDDLRKSLDEAKNTLDETTNALDEAKNTLDETTNALDEAKSAVVRILSELQTLPESIVEVDLSGANLQWARLTKSFLSRANLFGANLSRALLDDAVLSGADLSGADLSGADLSGADLSGANLHATKLFMEEPFKAMRTESKLSEVTSSYWAVLSSTANNLACQQLQSALCETSTRFDPDSLDRETCCTPTNTSTNK